jgi:hypothetical protein
MPAIFDVEMATPAPKNRKKLGTTTVMLDTIRSSTELPAMIIRPADTMLSVSRTCTRYTTELRPRQLPSSARATWRLAL